MSKEEVAERMIRDYAKRKRAARQRKLESSSDGGDGDDGLSKEGDNDQKESQGRGAEDDRGTRPSMKGKRSPLASWTQPMKN